MTWRRLVDKTAANITSLAPIQPNLGLDLLHDGRSSTTTLRTQRNAVSIWQHVTQKRAP